MNLNVRLAFTFIIGCIYVENMYCTNLKHLMDAAVDERMRVIARNKRSVSTTQTNTSDENEAKERRKKVTELLDNLLQQHDKYMRPGFGGPPLDIHVNFVLTSLGPFYDFEAAGTEKQMSSSSDDSSRHVSIDPEAGVQVQSEGGKGRNSADGQEPEFTFQCFFRHFWTDERLQFNDSLEAVLILNSIMLDQVWKPDTFFRGNAQNSYIHDITQPNRLFRLESNGSIIFSTRFTITAKCPMDFSNFPMDTQKCIIDFGSYGYSVNDMVYHWMNTTEEPPVTNTADSQMAQFKFHDYKIGEKLLISSTGNYSMLTLTFYFTRSLGFFVLQTYLPCTMIVCLSWVAFWINREAAPARISLGITTVLTMTTFSISSRGQIPKVSYPSAMDWFVLVSYFFVFMALVEYAAVNYFTKRNEMGKNYLSSSKIQNGPPAKKARLDEQNNEVVDSPPFKNMNSFCVRLIACLCGSIRYQEWKVRHMTTQFNSVSQIDELCRILFPCTFIFFNICYWSFYLLSQQMGENRFKLDNLT